MANYGFVIDSHFSPFTFQEMWQPALLYKQEAEKMQDKIDQIRDKADSFKYLSETLPEDSESRKIYEGYAQRLGQQADAMLQHGYNADTWAGMRELRQRYAGEIGMLEKADARKKAIEEEQRKARLQNPTLLFDNDASTKTIDDYLHNPNLGYTPYSGALITQRVSQAASALARGVQTIKNNGRLDEYTKTYLKQSGVTPEQVQAAIANPNDQGVLNSIVEGVIDSTGIKDWGNPAALKAAYAYGREGLYSAVGQSQVATYDDYGARLEAQKQKEIEMAKAKEEIPTSGGLLSINPLSIYSQKERTAKENSINKYNKYFTTNSQGVTTLTPEGLTAYKKGKKYLLSGVKHPSIEQSGLPFGAVNYQNEKAVAQIADFAKYMDEIGVGKYIQHGQVGNAGNAWNRYKKQNPEAKHDTTVLTEYDYDTQEQSDIWKQKILMAARGTDYLNEVDFDSKSHQFKTQDRFKVSDLDDDKVKILSVRFSPYTINGTTNTATVMVKDKDGKVHRLEMPVGINERNEQFRDQAMKEAREIQELLQKKDLSDSEKQKLINEYQTIIQEAYLYNSQLATTNKTKSQEIESKGY